MMFVDDLAAFIYRLIGAVPVVPGFVVMTLLSCTSVSLRRLAVALVSV